MSKLKPSQEQAAMLLVEGKNSKEVANTVGVTPETISHWKANPIFKAYYNDLRGEVMESSVEKLRSLFGKAADTVGNLLDEDRPDVRLRAAQTILKIFAPSDMRSRALHLDTGETSAATVSDDERLEQMHKQLDHVNAFGDTFLKDFKDNKFFAGVDKNLFNQKSE